MSSSNMNYLSSIVLFMSIVNIGHSNLFGPQGEAIIGPGPNETKADETGSRTDSHIIPQESVIIGPYINKTKPEQSHKVDESHNTPENLGEDLVKTGLTILKKVLQKEGESIKEEISTHKLSSHLQYETPTDESVAGKRGTAQPDWSVDLLSKPLQTTPVHDSYRDVSQNTAAKPSKENESPSTSVSTVSLENQLSDKSSHSDKEDVRVSEISQVNRTAGTESLDKKNMTAVNSSDSSSVICTNEHVCSALRVLVVTVVFYDYFKVM